MKKTTKLFLGFMVAVFLITGFAFAKDSSKETLNFWYSMPETYKSTFENIITSFNEGNKFNMVIKTTYFAKEKELKTALLNGKDLPDIAMIDSSWQKMLIEQNKIVAVEDQIKAISTMLMIVIKNDTFKPVFEACKTDNKVWTMPYYATNHALIYDKTVFDAKKIKKLPKTWTDIATVGQKLTDAKTGQWGFALTTSNDPEKLADLFQIFLWQSKGELSADANGNITCDTKKAQSLLKFWLELASKYKVAPIALPDDFSQIAMFIGTAEDYMKQKNNGRDVNVMTLPKKEVQVTNLDVTSIAIMKNDEKKIRKAWQFVYWLTEHQQAVKWAVASPYIPANKQVVLCPEYFHFMGEHPGMKIFVEQMKSVKIAGTKGQADEAMRSFGEKIIEALQGKQKVEDLF